MMQAQLDIFHGNIHNFDFSDKKNQISKILSMWVFMALKCQQSFKILQLVWTLQASSYKKTGVWCFARLKIIIQFFGV